MPTLRAITIIIFSAIAAFVLYFYVFKGNAPSVTSSPLPTATSEPSASAAPSPSALPNTSPSVSSKPINLKNGMHQITLQTNFGDITFQTYDADAPMAVKNFISLSTKRFYNSLIFHRVIKDFMIQGGDPSGNGTGGPGYSFKDELNPATESYKQGYVKGVIAMANAGPDTNGSQFFIMLKDTPLPHNYSIFGKVIAGLDVVDKIGNVPTGSADRPVDPVIIKSVIVNTL